MLAVRDMVRTELESRKFPHIPESQDQYFHKDHRFAGEVYDTFPDARPDIAAAGTAFAMELYTACVFHLMRVAEYGLRELARRLRVRISHKSSLTPLEYADWGTVVSGAKAKITAAGQFPHGPKGQRQLEMYSDAVDHCE